MEIAKKSLNHTLLPLFFLLGLFTLLAIPSTTLFKGSESSGKPTTEIKTSLPGNSTQTNTKGSSVDVNVHNQTQTNQNSSGNVAGTCTVTKNGVTETVPSGNVNVNEKSSGAISVMVECNNSSSSTNGSSSNKTSVKNGIEVNVKSSN